jgi:hypothetical protein
MIKNIKFIELIITLFDCLINKVRDDYLPGNHLVFQTISREEKQRPLIIFVVNGAYKVVVLIEVTLLVTRVDHSNRFFGN